MKTRTATHLAALVAFSFGLQTVRSDAQPAAVVDLNTPRSFPAIASAQAWENRAKEIRQQVLVSCGLWPMPEKRPINASVFGKIERDGYSVEKVYFETWPGLYLAGNLYRPLGRGRGPFPGILNPHGHWSNGRMADTEEGSVAGRCISFARQGMIAFSYDMIGYNDTHFSGAVAGVSFSDLHHQVATNKADLLWNINLMGLQTWDSIRALDFLESLPDVDRKRLACTGASGGGTQTFVLGAIEDRLAAQAPVVMVSHIMQGGCLCENAPGLRVEFSNMELAAAAAPRPQLLVAASGDWTKDTLTVEGPAIAQIYKLLHRENRFNYVRFDFNHNYNQTSREAVYAWFGKWLLHAPDPEALKEAPFHKEPDTDLRVFPQTELPAGAKTLPEFLSSLRDLHRRAWLSLVPQDPEGLKRFRAVMLPAWKHTLQVGWPSTQPQVLCEALVTNGDTVAMSVKIREEGKTNAIQCRYWAPSSIAHSTNPKIVVLASSDEVSGQPNDSAVPERIHSFIQRGMAVLSVEQFSCPPVPDPFNNFYTTYNRTEAQERVRDLLVVCSAARGLGSPSTVPFRVILAGLHRAGLWTLLAAPGADAVIADSDALDAADESSLLAADIFCPGLLAMGGFEGVVMLAAPHPLLLHNTGARFSTDSLRRTYDASGVLGQLRIKTGHLTDTEIAESAAQF